jgi:hypothetical protein
MTAREPAPTLGYDDLAMTARQALALVAFTEWRRRVGLVDPACDRLVDHLWSWLDVCGEARADFTEWYEGDASRTPLLAAVLSPTTPLLDSTTVAAERAGVEPDHLRAVLLALVSITYGSLFGAADRARSLVDLEAVVAAATADGAPRPSADAFSAVLWQQDDEWGRPSIATIVRWRGDLPRDPIAFLRFLRTHRGMFILDPSFASLAAFLSGYDQGDAVRPTLWGAELNRWLAERLGAAGPSVVWPVHVAQAVLGPGADHDLRALTPDEDAAACALAFDVLEEYLVSRATRAADGR